MSIVFENVSKTTDNAIYFAKDDQGNTLATFTRLAVVEGKVLPGTYQVDYAPNVSYTDQAFIEVAALGGEIPGCKMILLKPI